jgi:hypothetical protein
LLLCALASCGTKAKQPEETVKIAETRRDVPALLRKVAGFIDEVTSACAYQEEEAEISKLQQISQHARDVAMAYENDQTATNEDKALYAMRRMGEVLGIDVLSLHCVTEESRYRYDKAGELARKLADQWQAMFELEPLGKK